MDRNYSSDRWEGAERLSESLGYRRQRRPYRSVLPELLQVPPDLGCAVSPKCTECPLNVCVEELPRQVRAQILAEYKQRPQR
jgi:hypothetical protein